MAATSHSIGASIVSGETPAAPPPSWEAAWSYTLAYWLGNPILNPATMVFLGFALGWRWAAVRLVVGLVLVFGVAALAGRSVRPEDIPADAEAALAVAAQPRVLAGRSVWGRWARARPAPS